MELATPVPPQARTPGHTRRSPGLPPERLGAVHREAVAVLTRALEPRRQGCNPQPTVDNVCARGSDDGAREHACIASVAQLSDPHHRARRVRHGAGTHTVATTGGDGLGDAGPKPQQGAQVLALIDHHGDVWAPRPVAPVAADESVRRPEGLQTVTRVGTLTGVGLTGSDLHLEGGLDATSNRQASFKAGMRPHITEHPRPRQRPTRGRTRWFQAASQA